MHRMKSRAAFSLVELSIVLVILGLLTGGILAGQSLIRAAELRSVAADMSRFVTASYTFRDKYFALAGDMTNAESFWGTDSSGCPSGGGATGTCNGNGDGILSGTNEGSRYWQQLAFAGLIEGKYTGTWTAAGAVPGTNVPRGKISNTGFSASYLNYVPGDASNTQMNYGNEITFGGVNPGFDTSNAVLKPEEMWNIDTKIDDGKPGQGNIIALYWDTCTTAASFTDLNGAYALDVNSIQCSFRYKNGAG
ncbi:MAG: type II secretion system protein [Rickettsiales bacterium]